MNGIYLKKGQNTVKITMSWGYFSLDYITIEKMSVSNAYTAAEKPLDPSPSQTTQPLYIIKKRKKDKKKKRKKMGGVVTTLLRFKNKKKVRHRSDPCYVGS